MKRFIGLLLAAVLLLCFTGCNKASQESSSATESSSSQSTPVLHEISGTVTGVTDSVFILSAKGQSYHFYYGNAAITGENGLLEKCTATVFYFGELDAALQTQTTTVERVLVTMYYDAALDILADMTVEEKIGQLFFVCGPSGEDVQAVEKYHIGGYVFFASDIKNQTPDTLRAKIQSYQNASGIPLLIGVDEEGGTVVRVSLFRAFRDAPFESPAELYANGGMNSVAADTLEKVQLLKSLGFNVNLAPVCDVSTDPADFIYARSFGQEALPTAQYVQTVVSIMSAQGMGSVLKHFPGYGSNSDTHTGIAHDTRDYETFATSDFLPFKAGVGAGADAIMVSHNIIYCMDDTLPASLSTPVHDILRSQLEFDGVVMTDDLSMAAISGYFADGEATVTAIEAGNDLLCCFDFEPRYVAVLEAVNSGRITEDRLDESVLRILHWKAKLGLI